MKQDETDSERAEDVYDEKGAESMLEDDELTSEEAGFMEGYNEKQSKEPKKPKDIVQDDSK